MSTVDLVIILLVAVMAVFGFYKGFIKSLISLLGFLVSLVLAILLAKVVGNALLSVDFFASKVAGSSSLYSWLYGHLPASLQDIKTEYIIMAGDSVEELFASESPWFIKIFYPLFSSGLNNSLYLSTLDNARQIIALELAYSMFILIVGILLFIAIRIVATIISLIFKRYTKGKKLLMGRVLGAVIGASKAIIYSMIILCVFTFMANFGFMQTINEKVRESRLGAGLTDASVKISSSLIKSKDDYRYERLLEFVDLELKPSE